MTTSRDERVRQLLIAVALIGFCVASRLFDHWALRNAPLLGFVNFKPVAAAALFAGFLLRNRFLALAVPLLSMGIADASIGAYQWQVMVSVYFFFALPIFWGPLMRRWFNPVALLGCSLLGSTLFFVGTNAAHWLFMTDPPHTFAGLITCYAQAIPFFRPTVIGDLVFNVILFGAYGLWLYRARVATPKPALSESPFPTMGAGRR